MEVIYTPFQMFQLFPALAVIPAVLMLSVVYSYNSTSMGPPMKLVICSSSLWILYTIWEYRVQGWTEKITAPIRVNLLITALLLTLATADARAAGEQLQRIVVISDLNGRYASTHYNPRVASAVARIIELAPDLVISTGDMVAGQRPSPKLQRAELDAMWSSFHRQVRAPLEQAGIPLVSTPGNHDASAYNGFELEREAYERYHIAHPPLFTPVDGGNFPYHFATEISGLLLISLDATTVSPIDDAQYNWLVQQLCERGDYQATFVFGHLPLQPVAVGRERDVITDPRLEALLAATEVSGYLSGHHHAFYPGYRIGIDMLSIGNLGGNQRSLVGTTQTTGFSFVLIEIQPEKTTEISAYSAPDFREAIDISLLPEHLGDGQRRLNRRDLAKFGPASFAGQSNVTVCPAPGTAGPKVR